MTECIGPFRWILSSYFWTLLNTDSHVFKVAKNLTIFEMLMLSLGTIISSLVVAIPKPNPIQIAIIFGIYFAYIVYLSVELYGLHKRKHGIIVLGSVVRCLQSITILIFMFIIPLLGLDGFNRFLQDTFKSTGIMAVM